MTDNLKVKVNKAADDANVAAHAAYDDATVVVHNALKGAGVDAQHVSDDAKTVFTRPNQIYRRSRGR